MNTKNNKILVKASTPQTLKMREYDPPAQYIGRITLILFLGKRRVSASPGKKNFQEDKL